MPANKRLTVSELRANLPAILQSTVLFGESFTIMKHGQPFAVLSPVTDQEELDGVRARLDQAGENRISAEDVLAAEVST